MQLNKDILTKEKLNIDLIKYPFHSYPFPKSPPFGQELASGADGGACAAVERKGKETAIQRNSVFDVTQ